MSLHKFAEQVAQHGRGDDSLLVHMTPDEVQRLQKFAEANGRSLTINPHTGLPEAGFLSDLFKAVAPIALGAFLGPAGFGLSTAMAGVATGGITALATGSLSRGLMAGLGAYGGAGLGESLMTAGGGMSAANAATAAQGQLGATNLALGEALPAQAAEQFTKDAVARMAPSGAVSAGFNAATASPTAAMDFAKANYKPLLAAASPIMAGMMVPTTTQVPQGESKGMIRQMAFNINPDTGKPDPLYGVREMAPVKASEWGDKTFQGQRDLFYKQNPNPYELGVGSLNQPPQQPARMAAGGIVALADGGIPGYAGTTGSLVKDASGMAQADINAALAAELAARKGTSQADLTNYAKTAYNLSDAQINAAYDTIPGFNAQGKYDAADYIATHQPGQVSPQMVVDAAAAANPYSAQNMAKVDVTRPGHYVQDPITGQQVALTGYSPGFDINNPTALTYLGQGLEQAKAGTKNSAADWFSQNATAEQKAQAADLWAKEKARLEAIDRAAGRLPAIGGDTKPPTGLASLNQNLTNQNLTNQGAGLAAIPADASYTNRFFAERGLGFDPIDRSIDNFLATYKTQLASMTPKQQEDTMRAALDKERMNEADVIKATGMTIAQLIQQKRADGSIIVPGKLDEVPVGSLPGGVSGAGSTVINPNGTITTKPDFSLGMSDVRDAYTKGGGSLGYTSPAPKTIAEFNQLYNKQTGDSLAAYDYLMGKGGGKYPVKSGVSEIQKPYNEFVLGKKSTRPVSTKPTSTVKGVPGKPETYFDEAAYLAANPDVAAELKTGKSVTGQPTRFTSGYEHYLMYGKAGGRPFAGDYEGYQSAAAAAEAARIAQQGGGGDAGPSGPSANTGNTISGFTPAPPDMSIPEASMGIGPAADGNTGSTTGTEGGAVASARGGLLPRGYAIGGGLSSLGSYSDGGRLLKGPGDGVSDSIPATIGRNRQPARLADGEFVIPARIVSELGNGSTDAGAKKLYAMMDRVQRARGKTTGKNKVAANSRADKYLPA